MRSRDLVRVGLCVFAVLLGSGCSDRAQPAPSAKGAPPPAVPTGPNANPPATDGDSNRAAAGGGSDIAPVAANQPAPTASARPQPLIRLSAGVALPQSLPDGTTVMMSIDYEWVQGGPQQGYEYGWVVEMADGQRVSGPAKLSKRRGNIQAILQGIRPDRGPFKGAVFAKAPGAAPAAISEFVSLK